MSRKTTSALLLKKIDDFQWDETRKSAGKTGSKLAKCAADENSYQLKSPVERSNLYRQVKALGWDHENLGEFIASVLARSLVRATDKTMIPEISLVGFGDGEGVGIASKYLANPGSTTEFSQNLDGYRFDRVFLPTIDKDSKHVKFTTIALAHYRKTHPFLIKDLYRSIVLSAILGDHDINPGNMVVVTKKTANENGETAFSSERLSRIDFGHAFSDLLRLPKLLGGEQRHPNFIVDFFNREELAGGESKLVRDYPGFGPCQELSDAIKAFSTVEPNDFLSAVEEAKASILEVMTLQPKDAEQIVKSLEYIADHISPESERKKFDEDNLEDRITAVFFTIQIYLEKNITDLKYAADLIALQLEINQAVDQDDVEKLNECKAKFWDFLPAKEDPSDFVWVRDGKMNPAIVTGSIDDYISARKINTQKNQTDPSSTSPHKTTYDFSTLGHDKLLMLSIRIIEILDKVCDDYNYNFPAASKEQKNDKFVYSIPEILLARELWMTSKITNPITAFLTFQVEIANNTLNIENSRLAFALYEAKLIDQLGNFNIDFIKEILLIQDPLPSKEAESRAVVVQDEVKALKSIVDPFENEERTLIQKEEAVEIDSVLIESSEAKNRTEIAVDEAQALKSIVHAFENEQRALIQKEESLEIDVILIESLEAKDRTVVVLNEQNALKNSFTIFESNERKRIELTAKLEEIPASVKPKKITLKDFVKKTLVDLAGYNSKDMFIISDDRQRIVSGSFSGLYNQLKTEYDARRQEERFFKGAYFSDNIASFYKEKYKSAISSFSQLNDAQKFFIAIQYAETHDGHRTTVSLEALWQRGVCQKKPASLVGGISSSAFPTC